MTAHHHDIRGLVVLAERNTHIRHFLEREFAGRGAVVAGAADGRELARAVAEAREAGVVVLDLEIALLDEGMEALRASALPWLVIIHALLPDHADHPALPHADAVVEKGADPTALLDTVAAVAAGRTAERGAHEGDETGEGA
jgi:DNA-binding response OmpR family regulator